MPNIFLEAFLSLRNLRLMSSVTFRCTQTTEWPHMCR